MSTSVCVCVSVCGHMSRTTRAIFTKFFVRVAYHRGLVLVRRDDEIPRGRAVLVVFYALYSIAWDPYEAAEPIEMLLGLMTRVCPRYHALDGDPIPQREGAIFGGKRSGLL